MNEMILTRRVEVVKDTSQLYGKEWFSYIIPISVLGIRHVALIFAVSLADIGKNQHFNSSGVLQFCR